MNSELEREFGQRPGGASHAGVGVAFDHWPAPGFHLGRLHVEFPDRRRDPGRRKGTERLGRLLPERRGEEPRYRRYRVRPLPPLPGRRRADETARRSGLPVLGCLAPVSYTHLTLP